MRVVAPTLRMVAAVGADWTRDDVEVTFGDRWTARRCEGSAPLLCVRDGDRLLGDERAVGCPAFTFDPMAVTDGVVDGGPAVRTGFVLRDAQHRQVEHVVVHVTVRERTMWTVTASAYVEDGGCLPAEQDFDPETLGAFEP